MYMMINTFQPMYNISHETIFILLLVWSYNKTTHPQQFSIALLQIVRTHWAIAPPAQPIGNAISLMQDLLKGPKN